MLPAVHREGTFIITIFLQKGLDPRALGVWGGTRELLAGHIAGGQEQGLHCGQGRGEVAVQLGRGPARAAVRQPLHSRLSLSNSAGSAAPPPGIVLPGPTSWRAAQVPRLCILISLAGVDGLLCCPHPWGGGTPGSFTSLFPGGPSHQLRTVGRTAGPFYRWAS